MLARFLRKYSRRRWAYAFGEVLSLSLAGFCALTLWSGRRYEINGDSGLATITAICILLLTLIVFVGIVIERERDPKV